MTTTSARPRESTVVYAMLAGLLLSALGSGLQYAIAMPGHPYRAIAIGVAVLIGWGMGSIDDDSEYEFSPVRLCIFAVFTLVLTAIFGTAGLVAATILSFVWGMARVATGGQDCAAIIVSIILLFVLAWWKNQLGL